MKIGVKLNIDVKKIIKEQLFTGKKGVYMDATIFLDLDVEDKFGNSGMITQDTKADDKGPILGNAKIFWRESGQSQPQQAQQPQQQAKPVDDSFDDSIPF